MNETNNEYIGEPVAWLHEWVPGAPVIGKVLLFTSETVHGDAVRVRPLIYGDTTPQPQPEQEVPDGVWEALQRLIENGGSMGPASQEDAILVAQYRDRVRFMTQPAILSQHAPLAGEVTDERLLSEWDRVSHIAEAGNRRLAFARAILALRPQAVPMTDDQIVQGQEQQGAQSILSFMKGVRFVEAHHGITANAEGI